MLNRTEERLPQLMAPRDRLARPLRDLRLSVIDRCNFRCSYCMPESSLKGKDPFLSRQDLLTGDEFVRLVSAFGSLGVTRVRLTGGEPLLRPGFPGLVRNISRIPGIEDLSMTTNGILLHRLARELKEAGLNRITVSLDSLDEAVFARLSGGRGSVAGVLEGIAAAEAAGFSGLKINCVVQRGVNDHTVMDMVEYFRGSGHILRLIEFLDVGSSNDWRRSQVVPGHEWLKRIHRRWRLHPLHKTRTGETAQRYAYQDGQGEIGLINSITQPFCGHCSRARVTAAGMLHSCLFSGTGTPLRPLLRCAADSPELEGFIREAWSAREDRYSEIRHSGAGTSTGQEMYRMGG
jgi:cyclic pyranopterin phosphate synthase